MVEGGICPHWNPEHVSENLQGRLIYKDECARSFATPKDEDGLEVCLKTLVGHSNPKGVPDEQSFSKINVKNTGHPLVMIIKKTKKATDGPVKVTKLAIGKPGGIDPETDNYDTSVSVYCHFCKKYLNHEIP